MVTRVTSHAGAHWLAHCSLNIVAGRHQRAEHGESQLVASVTRDDDRLVETVGLAGEIRPAAVVRWRRSERLSALLFVLWGTTSYGGVGWGQRIVACAASSEQ